MTEIQNVITETRARRDEAQLLLGALIDARSQVELASQGIDNDAYKGVTGKSSMDRAIDRTRRLVQSFDRVLDELQSDLTDDDLQLLAEIEAEQARGGAAGNDR